MLDQVKLLLGLSSTDTSKDDLLDTLIQMCSDEAVAYCNLLEYDEKLDRIVIKMVIQTYNRIGSEGVASQSFSGVGETFIDGYTLDIKTALNRYRKMVLL
jgi:hypothetical protein